MCATDFCVATSPEEPVDDVAPLADVIESDGDIAALADGVEPDATVEDAGDDTADVMDTIVGYDVPDVEEDIEADSGGGDVTEEDIVGPPDALELDPDTLTFFFLPIGSIRLGVSGYAPDAGLCITAVWWWETTPGAHCSPSSMSLYDPYILIEPSDDPSCGQWDYGPNATMTSWTGCVDSGEFNPVGHDAVHAEIDIESEWYTGTVRISNLEATTPAPVFMGLRFLSDIPESLYVQSTTAEGIPGWVEVVHDRESYPLFDPCGVEFCGEPTTSCDAVVPQVADVSSGNATGDVHLVWDGKLRTFDAEQGCTERVAAEPGDYEARFCWGFATEESEDGTTITLPQCTDVPFEYPTAKVETFINNGG